MHKRNIHMVLSAYFPGFKLILQQFLKLLTGIAKYMEKYVNAEISNFLHISPQCHILPDIK